jgi:hypothetical protein
MTQTVPANLKRNAENEMQSFWSSKRMTDDYLIQKKPFNALLIFSLPIIIGNLFQQTYTMADSAIAGRFVGERALAAIGASNSLTNIFICIAIGGGIGASVMISRYFGAKNFYQDENGDLYGSDCLSHHQYSAGRRRFTLQPKHHDRIEYAG